MVRNKKLEYETVANKYNHYSVIFLGGRRCKGSPASRILAICCYLGLSD
jgi:hypothetical protein